jgi:hypothetical protein
MNVIVVPLRVIYLSDKFGACGFECFGALIEPVLRNSKQKRVTAFAQSYFLENPAASVCNFAKKYINCFSSSYRSIFLSDKGIQLAPF